MGKKGFEKPKIEKELTIEREEEIDKLIEGLADEQKMSFDDVLSDIIVFAPYKGNESANPNYIEELAERIGISAKEMTRYAIEKVKDSL